MNNLIVVKAFISFVFVSAELNKRPGRPIGGYGKMIWVAVTMLTLQFLVFCHAGTLSPEIFIHVYQI